MGRRLFQWFTVLLLAVTGWMAWANVYSDNTEVRAKAREVVNEAAGCGEGCKLQGLRGDRGMLETTIEYDIVGRGHFVVVCRRAKIAFGDYACSVTESTSSAPATSAGTKR